MEHKILVAVDSFKGSMSSNAIGSVFKKHFENSESVSVADGGEGSLESLQKIDTYQTITFSGKDTYLNSIKQTYLIKGETAYIETALICGLDEKKDIMQSSSLGVGLALRDAYMRGIKEVYVFLGGTGSNDGGMGVLAGLGYEFLDKKGNVLIPITQNLGEVYEIIEPRNPTSFEMIYLVSDVTNPLLGELGATHVFGAQKGADETMVINIEYKMKHFVKVLEKYFTKSKSSLSSSGAAGGIPFVLMLVYPVTVISGIEYISAKIDLKNKIDAADIVITGEGKIDSQSFYGKVIQHIISLCHEFNKPYLLVCGLNEVNDYEDDLCLGIYELMSVAKDLQDSIENGEIILDRLIKSDIKPNILKYK